jgi:hypothetical protein
MVTDGRPEDDAPETPDPRIATLVAESGAITPYLSTWLMSGQIGQFVIGREVNGALTVSVVVVGENNPRLLSVVPGN